MEAEEDIKSATRGTLQDLFLALAKVRRPGLQGKGVTAPGRGLGPNGGGGGGRDSCAVKDKTREGFRADSVWFGLVRWPGAKKLLLKESS